MIDWSKPIETTSGLKAKVISDDFRSLDGKRGYVIQVENKLSSFIDKVNLDGFGGLVTYRNVKTKREGWINIYRDSTTGIICSTKEVADNSSCRGRVACVKVEWEE